MQRYKLVMSMVSIVENKEKCLEIIFSEELTIHISGKLRHYGQIWSNDNPHHKAEYARESPNVSICFVVLFHQTVRLLSLCGENNEVTYVAMLQQTALPKVEEMRDIILFQQDDSPHHCGYQVVQFLNKTFLDRWTTSCEYQIPQPLDLLL